MSTKGPRHLVFAEDDADDRMMLERVLGSVAKSKKATFVHDGEDLMDYLLLRNRHKERKGGDPAAVVVDLDMPAKTGLEALAEIRANPRFVDVPVVILTTSDEQDKREEALKLGAAGFYTKPTSFAEMTRVLRQILNLASWRHAA